MSIKNRVESLEKQWNIKSPCNVIIVLYRGMEGPREEQIEQHRKAQKESGKCENCGGLCYIDLTGKVFPPGSENRLTELEKKVKPK